LQAAPAQMTTLIDITDASQGILKKQSSDQLTMSIFYALRRYYIYTGFHRILDYKTGLDIYPGPFFGWSFQV
jgi:hypothetical protein